MPQRPACVAFDMVETTFSLEKLRPRFEVAGLAGHRMETWFAGLLRDAFALDTIGQFTPFPDLAKSSLAALGLSDEQVSNVIDGFATLDVHPDAAPAMTRLRAAGIRVLALTNGSEDVTRKILEHNGLDSLVERVISITEIGRWKPAPEVYEHAAQVAGVPTSQMALFAVHPWDCAGAANADYTTGFVSRHGEGWPSVMARPDVTGTSLVELADGVLAWDSA
ncbi:HAD-IA family hydrolase [Maribius pontilimi]|uniref:HAD-IA family hydrolase n=1 Tax=Palleronia pontilimi TaxID=1964209 RepID=A0A934I9K0_9RHOB|nr:HAD-IA family hydrolase [Palleronia pontilimi]MBJ3762999.1 HAD-IA family hydrolase [Palleronia pontilimi]